MNAILKSSPVVLTPDFDKYLKLVVDTSDVGAGAFCYRRTIKALIIQLLMSLNSLISDREIILLYVNMND